MPSNDYSCRMARGPRPAEVLKALSGEDGFAPPEDAELPPEFRLQPGESAKQYRDRVAPYFNEFLVKEAVLNKNSFAMTQFVNLQMKDMDTKVKLAQIVGPDGVKRMIAEGNVEDLKEMAGITGIPSASAGLSAGIAAGLVRPSDAARQV